jgi:hypothetical protein
MRSLDTRRAACPASSRTGDGQFDLVAALPHTKAATAPTVRPNLIVKPFSGRVTFAPLVIEGTDVRLESLMAE